METSGNGNHLTGAEQGLENGGVGGETNFGLATNSHVVGLDDMTGVDSLAANLCEPVRNKLHDGIGNLAGGGGVAGKAADMMREPIANAFIENIRHLPSGSVGLHHFFPLLPCLFL